MDERGVKHLRYFGQEVVTIVVGILLALGANAAYKYFADRADEREILAALRVEFEADIAEIDADQKHRDEKLAAIRLLLDTETGTAGGSSPRAFTAAVEATIGYRFYTASHPVLDDVLTTGRLDLIRSDALRQALMRFGAARSRIGVVEQLERDFVSSQLEPFVASRLDLASLGAASPVPTPNAIDAVSVLRTDPHFRSLLFLDEKRTKSSHGFAELLRERVLEVQAALGPQG